MRGRLLPGWLQALKTHPSTVSHTGFLGNKDGMKMCSSSQCPCLVGSGVLLSSFSVLRVFSYLVLSPTLSSHSFLLSSPFVDRKSSDGYATSSDARALYQTRLHTPVNGFCLVLFLPGCRLLRRAVSVSEVSRTALVKSPEWWKVFQTSLVTNVPAYSSLTHLPSAVSCSVA